MMRRADDQLWRLLARFLVGALILILTLNVPGAAALLLLWIPLVRMTYRMLSWLSRADNYKSRQQAALQIRAILDQEEPLPFFLYLRPFEVDKLTIDLYEEYNARLFSVYSTKLDEELALALDDYGPLICIGEDKSIFAIGSPRIPSTDQTWKKDVVKLMNKSRGIILVPSLSGGTGLETEAVLRYPDLRRKTIFVYPPRVSTPRFYEEWPMLEKHFQRAGIAAQTHTDGLLFTSTGSARKLYGGFSNQEEFAQYIWHSFPQN